MTPLTVPMPWMAGPASGLPMNDPYGYNPIGENVIKKPPMLGWDQGFFGAHRALETPPPSATFNLNAASLAAMPIDPATFVRKITTDNGNGSGMPRDHEPDVQAALPIVLQLALVGGGMPLATAQPLAKRIMSQGPSANRRACELAARIVSTAMAG